MARLTGIRKERFLIFLLVILFVSCSQGSIKSVMRSQVIRLIKNLEKGDTTAVMNMMDSSFSGLNTAGYRDYHKSVILADQDFLKKLFRNNPRALRKGIKFEKDSLGKANVAVCLLFEGKDSSLNIKKAVLYAGFYPDEYFGLNNGKILNYNIIKEPIMPNPHSDKILPLPKNPFKKKETN